MNESDREFARLLLDRRRVAGVSQGALADALGVDATTISRWERRIYPVPIGKRKRVLAAVRQAEVNTSRAVLERALTERRRAERLISETIEQVIFLYARKRPQQVVPADLIERARALRELRSKGLVTHPWEIQSGEAE